MHSGARCIPVPVEADQPVPVQQGCHVACSLSQLLHEFHRHSVVVIMAELQAGLPWFAQGIDILLADLAVRSGRARQDHGLGKTSDQCSKSFEPTGRHGIANKDREQEIRIGPRLETRQAKAIEMPKPLFHAGRYIELGHSFLETGMRHLKAAFGGIGKPAESDDLHPVVPCAMRLPLNGIATWSRQACRAVDKVRDSPYTPR